MSRPVGWGHMTPRTLAVIAALTAVIHTVIYREWLPVVAATLTVLIIGAIMIVYGRRKARRDTAPPSGRTAQ